MHTCGTCALVFVQVAGGLERAGGWRPTALLAAGEVLRMGLWARGKAAPAPIPAAVASGCKQKGGSVRRVFPGAVASVASRLPSLPQGCQPAHPALTPWPFDHVVRPWAHSLVCFCWVQGLCKPGWHHALWQSVSAVPPPGGGLGGSCTVPLGRVRLCTPWYGGPGAFLVECWR